MNSLFEQEQRLEQLKCKLRSKYNGVLNPVELLDRLVTLQDRVEKVQSKLENLIVVKQELALALHESSATCDHVTGNRVVNELNSTVKNSNFHIKEAFAKCIEVQENINYVIDKGGRRQRQDLVSSSKSDEDSLYEIPTDTYCFSHVEESKENFRDGSTETNLSITSPAKQIESKFTIHSIAFEALPSSIRGRAKLSEVQATLDAIVHHFESQPKRRRTIGGSNTVSVQTLDRQGVKVAGKTGQQILQCLRSLGFIEISKEGVCLKAL